ncbi:MAG: hypothetical protein A2176_06215 [Spirochaetes bacterium RBG_13_51_14]|nr:MAG: hypothetical protein A2176_06215 [Spirochaetes bacterium RBG_13_51_14]
MSSLLRIPLADIDLEDRYYKISRNHIDDAMRNSIRNFGVLDPPVVLERDGRYRVIFGFNRLDALADCGANEVDCMVTASVDAEFFMNRALLKCQRNESGPVGRIRILAILRDFGLKAAPLSRIAKKGLQVPDEFVRDESLMNMVERAPVPLKDYCDSRDIQFRIIGDVMRLPRASIEAISSWLVFAPLRVNIFKFLAEMLSDILARDGSLDLVDHIRPDESTDRKAWEQHLYETIRRVRYPEYSSLRNTAENVVRYFSAWGVRVDYPVYFEGDIVEVRMSLRKGDDPESVRKKINGVDWVRIKELLDLL